MKRNQELRERVASN